MSYTYTITIQSKGIAMARHNNGNIITFQLNASRRKEDATILAKLNAVTPHLYRGDGHKTGRLLLEKALDDFLGEHNIEWIPYLSAMTGG